MVRRGYPPLLPVCIGLPASALVVEAPRLTSLHPACCPAGAHPVRGRTMDLSAEDCPREVAELIQQACCRLLYRDFYYFYARI